MRFSSRCFSVSIHWCAGGPVRLCKPPNRLRPARGAIAAFDLLFSGSLYPESFPSDVILIQVSLPLNFHLEHYDGPLDLLLDLIRKQQIDIYDIPIAQITSQYLEFMQRALAMDIELSAEFVHMAATLIHIKSKMLLPRDPELEKIDPEEDPRKELVDKLLEHERFKAAAEMLHQKRQIEEAVWSNP